MIVVSDTTALNYLILIGYPAVLRDLFQKVVLPEAVFQELSSPQASEEVRTWCSSMPQWCHVEAVKTVPSELMHLGSGEREAIALAEQLKANLLLIDEARGRRTALQRGLQITGTLGILDQAAILGLIDINDALQRLRQQASALHRRFSRNSAN
jgi:predicted nucleic acid-binding protein